MKPPKLIIEDGKLKVEGDYGFHFSFTYLTEDDTPTKKVSFEINLEVSHEIQKSFSNEEIQEAIGEKIKQDFVKKVYEPYLE